MSTTVTAQTIAFLLPQANTIDVNAIIADSGIQSAITNSLGQDVLINFQLYYNFTSGTQTQQSALLLTFMVTSAVATSIVSGIPALQTRVQAQQPQITRVVTWGETRVIN